MTAKASEALGTECECGEELDFHSWEEVLDFAMDETNNACHRATARALIVGSFGTLRALEAEVARLTKDRGERAEARGDEGWMEAHLWEERAVEQGARAERAEARLAEVVELFVPKKHRVKWLTFSNDPAGRGSGGDTQGRSGSGRVSAPPVPPEPQAAAKPGGEKQRHVYPPNVAILVDDPDDERECEG